MNIFIIAYILVGFAILRKGMAKMSLQKKEYFKTNILLEAIKKWEVIIFGCLTSVILIVGQFITNTNTSYTDFVLHLFLFFSFIPVTWLSTLVVFNSYWNQWHWDIRITLLLLQILLLFTFVLLPLQLALSYIFFNQYTKTNYVMNSYSDKGIILDAFLLFESVLLIHLIIDFEITNVYLFLLLSLIGVYYIRAGVKKLQLKNYASYSNTHLMTIHAFLNGWTCFNVFKTEKQVIKIVNYLGKFALLMSVGTLIVEFLGFALTWNMTILITSLLLFIGFHFVILFTTGINFWKWVWLEVAVISLVLWLSYQQHEFWFEDSNLHLIALGCTCFLYFITIDAFAPQWYSSNYGYRFEFEGVGENKMYILDANYFRPYDYGFGYARFWFLTHQPRITDFIGSIDTPGRLSDLKKILNTQDLEALERLKMEIGTDLFSEEKKQQFSVFLKTFLKNKRKGGISSILRPPRRNCFKRKPSNKTPFYDFTEPLNGVDIYIQEWLYAMDKNTILWGERKLLHQVSWKQIEEAIPLNQNA